MQYNERFREIPSSWSNFLLCGLGKDKPLDQNDPNNLLKRKENILKAYTKESGMRALI